jgi:hypothetical protein
MYLDTFSTIIMNLYTALALWYEVIVAAMLKLVFPLLLYVCEIECLDESLFEVFSWTFVG